MITAKEKKLIEDGYSHLRLLNNITWTSYREELFSINKKNEKNHRDNMLRADQSRYDDYSKAPLSVTAKYFCVRHILESLDGKTSVSVKSYLHLDKSYFLAHSLVENYGNKLLDAFKGYNRDDFYALDYCEMVRSDREVALTRVYGI